MANYVRVGRTSVEKVLKDKIENMSNRDLAELYCELSDNQVLSDEGYFLTPEEEAKTTGMIIMEKY